VTANKVHQLAGDGKGAGGGPTVAPAWGTDRGPTHEAGTPPAPGEIAVTLPAALWHHRALIAAPVPRLVPRDGAGVSALNPRESAPAVPSRKTFKIRRGLDIPVAGQPEQRIHEGPALGSVALLGRDYRGRKRLPSVLVEEGERVRLGQPLTRGKHYTEIVATAPGAGVVEKIERGERRFLQSVSIRLDGDQEETFNAYRPEELAGLNREQVRENLLASGLWLALKARPYSMVADPADEPHAIFVTAMDTNPLAADPQVVIAEAREAFVQGIIVIAKLTQGPVFVCTAPAASIPVPDDPAVRVAEFAGPHPAGLVGTHIHFLAPVGPARTVWYLGYQHVIAIGRLFTTGRLSVERVISLAGPMLRHPRLIRTRFGANTNELVKGELHGGETRVISGSVLSGHHAVGANAYLGRFHNQVCALREGREREFFGWLGPGTGKFSAIRVLVSSFLPGRRFDLTTSQNGSPRAMVPIGAFERVVPLDILPTQLLRALVVRDTDTAQALGCLELDEEDVALCSFVDPGKYDYAPILRENLEQIRKEG
jgi:Na+-transporting NADH:ubiquinone oxidoreductase subunit A